MTINKWLCDQFDEEKKGYVTVGNVARKLLIRATLFGIFAIVYPYLLYRGILFFISGRQVTSLDDVGVWGAVLLLGSVALVLLSVLCYISQTKIAGEKR